MKLFAMVIADCETYSNFWAVFKLLAKHCMFDLILPTSTSIKVFLYGECGGTGYSVTTCYSYWNGSYHGGDTQNDASGGYFQRGYGTHIYFSGQFRYFGDRIVNFGKAYAINQAGSFNEFVIEKITKSSTEPKLFGLDMT